MTRATTPRAGRWTGRALAALGGTILDALMVRGGAVDIVVLPDREIAALKARFIKKKTEPNVLSFPEPKRWPHPEVPHGRYLGEVYLNREILARSPERAAPLLLHGILHLLGYDHVKKADAARMERLEADALSKIAAPARRSGRYAQLPRRPYSNKISVYEA